MMIQAKNNIFFKIMEISTVILLLTSSGAIAEDFREDPERLRKNYEIQMSPEQYRLALESTGMAKTLTAQSIPTYLSTPKNVWVSKGPFGDFKGGNYNGRVSGIQILPTNSGYRIYAGAVEGGLWYSKSTTLGDWVSIGDRLQNPSVRAFAVNPNNVQHIIVGTGDFERRKGGGMFVTTNGGTDWNPVILPVATPEAFYRLYFLPGSQNKLIAASSEGILLSIDTGKKWTVEKSGHWTDIVINPENSSIMYACKKGVGVFKSKSYGEDWTQLTDVDLPNSADWGRASISICKKNPDILALMVEKDRNLKGIYRTYDGGNDWKDVTGNIQGFLGGMGDHAQAIAIRPEDCNQIYVGIVGLARTDNAGEIWLKGNKQTNIDHGHDDITQLYFSPYTGNNVLWICNDGGIYKHKIGGTTISVNGGAKGLSISQINTLEANRSMRVCGLQDNSIILSEDEGQSWGFPYQLADGSAVSITDPEIKNFWFTAGLGWNIFRKYYSAPYELITHPGGESSLPLFFDPFEKKIYTATDQAIVSRSENAGASEHWTQEIDDLQPDPYKIASIMGNAVDGKTIFIKYRKNNQRDLTIIRKINNTWDIIHRENIVRHNNSSIYRVIPSHQSSKEFWVTLKGSAGSPKILHTKDDGETWKDITSNLSDVQAVKSFAATPFNSNTLYAGTDIGVFRTINGGQTWDPFMDDKLPPVVCSQLRFVVNDKIQGLHKLVLGTYGRGVWERIVEGPPIVYVDKNYSGIEDGSYENPYRTVATAIATAPAGAIVAIRSNKYKEPQTIKKNIKLVTYLGESFIQ